MSDCYCYQQKLGRKDQCKKCDEKCKKYKTLETDKYIVIDDETQPLE